MERIKHASTKGIVIIEMCINFLNTFRSYAQLLLPCLQASFDSKNKPLK
jgi:hypothetical protein